MLPDFPLLKNTLHERLHEISELRTAHYLGIIGRIPRHQLHEGKGQILIRHDGSRDESQSVPIVVPITLDRDEIESLTMDQLIAKVDKAAREMAEKQSVLFNERFEQSVTEVANVVNAEGMTDVEAFFKLHETVDLDFNKDGTPDFPEIPQPNGQAWFERVRSRVTQDPVLRQTYTRLIERKREEFRDRENSRKLVG